MPVRPSGGSLMYPIPRIMNLERVEWRIECAGNTGLGFGIRFVMENSRGLPGFHCRINLKPARETLRADSVSAGTLFQ